MLALLGETSDQSGCREWMSLSWRPRSRDGRKAGGSLCSPAPCAIRRGALSSCSGCCYLIVFSHGNDDSGAGVRAMLLLYFPCAMVLWRNEVRPHVFIGNWGL